jgi:hypothetical protein
MHDLDGDRRDLGRCLAYTEDDFGETLSNAPMVVDAREAEIFERPCPQRLEQLQVCRARVDVAARQPMDEGLQFRRGHHGRVCRLGLLTSLGPISNIK